MQRASTLADDIQNTKNTVWLVLLVCLLALAVRMWGITFGLPGIDHGDESEVVNHAVRFGSGDLNPHRFQYGSLVQYLLFIIYGCYYVVGAIAGRHDSVHQFAVQFVSDPSMFYILARGLSACFGAATVWITYAIGKRVKGEGAGIVAALLLALCYQHVIHSHYATVDTAVTFVFSCAVYRSVMLLSDRRLGMYLYAGFFTGLAAGTKFNGSIALIAFATAHFSNAGRGRLADKLFSREWLFGLAAVIGGHALACPYFYIDFIAASGDISALQSFHATTGFNLWFYIRDIIRDYWGMPAGALCVVGMTRYVFTRKAGLRVIALTALSVILFASLHRYIEAKYILCAFPLTAVLGAALLTDLLSGIKTRSRSPLVLLMLLLLIMHPLYLILQWDAERGSKSITLESKEWIEQHIPSGSKILLDNAGNAGPKLANAPDNVKRQYERARAHGLLKAEFLKLLLEIKPAVYYDIVEIDSSAGSRSDDYQLYRLWQDTDFIGEPVSYYCDRGYDYIVVTHRYFQAMKPGFELIKDFTRGQKGIRVYQVSCGL